MRTLGLVVLALALASCAVSVGFPGRTPVTGLAPQAGAAPACRERPLVAVAVCESKPTVTEVP